MSLNMCFKQNLKEISNEVDSDHVLINQNDSDATRQRYSPLKRARFCVTLGYNAKCFFLVDFTISVNNDSDSLPLNRLYLCVGV